MSVLPAVHLVAPLQEMQDEPGTSQVLEMGEGLGLAADQMQSILDASFDEADEIAQLFA